MDWNDAIIDDSESPSDVVTKAWNPTQELVTYLETLYDSNDYVGYVTSDVWQDKDGRWAPSKDNYD